MKIKHTIAAAALALTGVVGFAGAAHADAIIVDKSAGGTIVYNSGGHTTSKFAYHTTYDGVKGTVYDTYADGQCARAYARTYDVLSGWNSWQYLGQSCGAGSSLAVDKNLGPDVVGGRQVSVCTGMPNSSRSNCTTRTIS